MTQATAVRDAPVQGVTRLDKKTAKLQRRMVLVFTVVPFMGLIAAVISLWGNGLSATDAGIALAFYAFTGLGVTVGFHRYLTHGSFDTNPVLRALFAIAGSMAVQGPVVAWVADHRRHHACADKEGDPHSPHLEEGPGLKGVVKGLAHAHMGWLFNDEHTSAGRWAPDMLKDPLLRKIDRMYPVWIALTFGLPPVLGFVLTGTLSGALTAFLWGSLVRIFTLHHVTWSINSICHFYGKRPYENEDFSTNNWVLSLISFGESWHNNHHAFPTSAIHGIGRGQVDLSGVLITSMEKLGVVNNVRRPSDKQMDAKTS